MTKVAEYFLNTSVLKPRQQLDYWVDAVCKTYTGMTVRKTDKSSPNSGFSAKMAVRELGQISISSACAERSCVDRTRANISNSSQELFLLYLQYRGQSQLRQASQDIHLRRGDLALCDGTRPSQLNLVPDVSQQHEMIVVKIPTPRLIAVSPGAHALAGIKMDGNTGVSAILSNLIVNAWERQDELTGHLRDQIADNLLSFIALSLNEHMPQRLPDSSLQAGHLLQVKQFINNRLTDPELSVAMISAANAITPRYLHKLFQTESFTVSQYIINRRLEECEKALRSPQYGHFSVTDIAHMWGFKDAAHFGHTFKRKFVLSPGEYRKSFNGANIA